MKKILAIAIFATLSLTASAQWEKLENESSQTEARAKRGLLDKKSKEPINPKYLEGAVPEVNGKVCWEKTFECNGKSADQVYDRIIEVMKELVKDEHQTEKSQIAVINKSERQIGVRLSEILVFSNSFLSLDQTFFNYTLIITCETGKCNVKMTNISYNYEPDRPSAVVYTAEEIISDKEALKKDKKSFTRGGSKKFRTKTIDRKDEVFEFIKSKL